MTAARSLRLDAAYCAAAGVIAVAVASPLGRLFHLPRLAVVAIGVAALVWAWLLARLARRDELRQPVAVVAAANAAASAALLVLSAIAAGIGARLLLAAVAAEVAAFAASQTVIVRRGA